MNAVWWLEGMKNKRPWWYWPEWKVRGWISYHAWWKITKTNFCFLWNNTYRQIAHNKTRNVYWESKYGPFWSPANRFYSDCASVRIRTFLVEASAVQVCVSNKPLDTQTRRHATVLVLNAHPSSLSVHLHPSRPNPCFPFHLLSATLSPWPPFFHLLSIFCPSPSFHSLSLSFGNWHCLFSLIKVKD